MFHCATIPTDVNPALRPALDGLAGLLTNYHYSAHAASRIVAYVAAEGTLAGAPGLDPEDEPVAETTFVNGLEPVGFDDPAWGSLEDLDDLDAIIEEPERDPLAPGPILLGPDDGGPDPAIEECPKCGGWGGELGSNFGDYGWHPCYRCGGTGFVPVASASDHPPVEPDDFPDPTPDENWFHPSRDVLKAAGLAPIAGGAPLDGDRRDFEEWLSQVDQPYPPDDQVEPAGIFSPELMEDLYGIDAGRYA
jgi:hypothetical protein